MRDGLVMQFLENGENVKWMGRLKWFKKQVLAQVPYVREEVKDVTVGAEMQWFSLWHILQLWCKEPIQTGSMSFEERLATNAMIAWLQSRNSNVTMWNWLQSIVSKGMFLAVPNFTFAKEFSDMRICMPRSNLPSHCMSLPPLNGDNAPSSVAELVALTEMQKEVFLDLSQRGASEPCLRSFFFNCVVAAVGNDPWRELGTRSKSLLPPGSTLDSLFKQASLLYWNMESPVELEQEQWIQTEIEKALVTHQKSGKIPSLIPLFVCQDQRQGKPRHGDLSWHFEAWKIY